MMTATPLQLANAMCIIANKGYYYTPHFVKSVDNETPEDTALLNKFRVRHEPLTHISDSAFNAVIWGMQDVVTAGTARSAAIPGINICAKTGTAQNFRFIGGKKIELNENSMFVCFAPRENPKIAIAVVVENAGYGSTSAAPIASLLMEKYLNDTLRPESVKKAQAMADKNLMPSILALEQRIADSARAYKWFEMYKDSSLIKKYLNRRSSQTEKKDSATKQPAKTQPSKKPASAPQRMAVTYKAEVVLPDERYIIKRKTPVV
jgi:penicillin-binding protein 2